MKTVLCAEITYTEEQEEKRIILGESGPFEVFTDNIQQLFKSLQKENGRCTGYLYHEPPLGEARIAGWVFEKRVKYTDSNDTYLQSAWVELMDGQKEESTPGHYIPFPKIKDYSIHYLDNPDHLQSIKRLKEVCKPLEPEQPTITIFRKFKDGGDIIALFPAEEWDNEGNCSSYMHIGQHGAAHYQGMIEATTAATPAEYASLKTELESIGYNLKIQKKYTRK